MPTPVSVARQCLAEEAAAALNDAVAVAKRRSHGQTTSLHAVSALLALPSSTLRDACARAKSNAYSPRLQFRALELCVGVALDRISMSKSVADEPPVSNSLMAAIKRAQANQRRHPDTFHLYQQQMNLNSQNSSSVSVVKVDLKHFILSILDDPIVSRVFGDAGFRTHEIRMAILNPLTTSRFSSTSRCPPLFLCSLSDLESSKRGPSFQFPGVEKFDGNSRRIGEILVKGNRRNPLLIGVSADDALRNFVDGIKRGETGVLPKEIDGLSVDSVEQEISEFANGNLSQEMMVLKFKQVGEMVKNCQGPGVIVNCGDLKAMVDAGSSVVSELKRLLVDSGGKLWLIGFLAGDGEYKKLLEKFPSIELDWDLHLLPITTSKPSSIGGKSFKSSLMGSFVPFGGFFSNPSELGTLCTSTKSSSLCNMCNEKYEQELSVVLKRERSESFADTQKVDLPSWLQNAETGIDKRLDTVEAKDDKTVLDARVMSLKRKWSEICQRFHCSSTSQDNISRAKSQNTYFQDAPSWENTTNVVGGPLHGSRSPKKNPCMPFYFQNNTLPNPDSPRPVFSGTGVNKQGLEMKEIQSPSASQQNTSLSIAPHTCQLSVESVTTDLGLGTIYASPPEECGRKPNLQEHPNGIRDLYNTSRTRENSVGQITTSPSRHELDKQKNPWKVLIENFGWQIEAVQTISRTISQCRSGGGRYHGSNNGNIWLSFLGPDKVGKRKIAAAMADIVFGRKDKLLALDLSLQDLTNSFDPFVDCYDSKYNDLKSGRKMVVDYLAEELGKRPHSVVLLENIERADTIVQHSLSQAIKTGKFPDFHGRDINIKNVVVILSSSALKLGEDLPVGKVASQFPEEKILAAKKLQMEILVGSVDGSYSRNSIMNVSVTPSKIVSNEGPVKKRKLTESRSIIDLNLPVEDTEEDCNIDNYSDDEEDRSENLEVWLKELLEHIDENVVFKPFDFDSLSQKILKEIDTRLKKVVIGAKIFLEIDQEVMVQILAAAWSTDCKNSMEDWIEQVLFPSIEEVRQKCPFDSDFVMKLVPCHGLVVEEQASGVCLPARIYVNR